MSSAINHSTKLTLFNMETIYFYLFHNLFLSSSGNATRYTVSDSKSAGKAIDSWNHVKLTFPRIFNPDTTHNFAVSLTFWRRTFFLF